MSRRHAATKRKILPDIKYNSVLLAKFINKIMKAGKKELAEKIVYGAFDILEKKYHLDPFESFKTAINNAKPIFEVTSVRVGGSNYQVPNIVSESRGGLLAMRWIKLYANNRSEKSMEKKVAEAVRDTASNLGGAIKKKEETHRMAEANKAFSHLGKNK